jgi:hypothetical protein
LKVYLAGTNPPAPIRIDDLTICMALLRTYTGMAFQNRLSFHSGLGGMGSRCPQFVFAAPMLGHLVEKIFGLAGFIVTLSGFCPSVRSDNRQALSCLISKHRCFKVLCGLLLTQLKLDV